MRRCRLPLIKAPSRLAVLGVLLMLCVSPAPALADSPGYQPDSTPLPADVTGSSNGAANAGPSVSGAGTIVRAVAGLAVVLGVIYGLYWLLRTSARTRAGGDSRVRVVATVPLASNRSVHLLQAGDEYLLVGAGESGVTPIRAYSASEALALGLAEQDAQEPPVAVLTAPQASAPARGLLGAVRAWTVRT